MQKWRKFDLHLHTKKTKRDSNPFTDINKSNVESFIEKLANNNIELFAITNHNEIDLEQFKLIKEKADKKKITTIPGIEVNLTYKKINSDPKDVAKFQCNIILEDNKYLEENCKYLNELCNPLNNNVEGSFPGGLELKEFINKIITLKGRVIMILDGGKASSTVLKDAKNKKLDDPFWFYFNAFEGNQKFNIDIINKYFEKFLKTNNGKQVVKFMGTDNRDFNEYPDNRSRKGWTGTYFFVEPTFYGLLTSINYKYLVVNQNKKNADEYPIAGNILVEKLNYEYDNQEELSEEILLDRGVNVILGRRGSGKSELLKKIIEKINSKIANKNEYFVLEQNKLSNFISKSSSSDTYYRNKKNGNTISMNDIQTNFYKRRIFDKIKVENQEDIPDLGSTFVSIERMLETELKNITISNEEGLSNAANTFFGKYDKKQVVPTEIESLSKIIEKNKNNLIFQIFLKNINFSQFKKELQEVHKNEMKNIDIKYVPDVSPRLDIQTAELDAKNYLNSYIKKYKKYWDFMGNILDDIKKIIDSFYEEEVYVTDELENFQINAKIILKDKMCFDELLQNIGNINKIEKFNKFINDHKKNNIVKYKSRKQRNFNAAKKMNIEITKKLSNDDISNMSPGQIVETFIENLFSKNQYKAIIIDQPEDQLDALTVAEKIIEPIQEKYEDYIKYGTQIIFVTHDPKIAVNLGAINIIECSFDSEGIYNKNNFGMEKFFENENLINKIDGRKNYVHKRSDIYGRNY